jgi:hypothetical protein
MLSKIRQVSSQNEQIIALAYSLATLPRGNLSVKNTIK